jgi:Zinc finger, C2H2 type
MKNLHHTQFNRSTIYLLDCYKSCSGIEDPSNYENICAQCEKILRHSYEFRQLCQESHQKYLEATNEVKEIQLIEVYPELEVKKEILSDEELDVARKEALKVEEVPRVEDHKTAESDPDDEDAATEKSDPAAGNSKSVKSESSSDTEQLVVINTLNHYLLEGNFICEICDEMFDTSQDLNSHKKGHVWDTGTKAVKRDCPVCKLTVDNILAHLTKNHTDYKPNTCRQCDAAFAFPIQLRKHLVTHLKGVFECKACTKKYSSLKLLKTHIGQTRHYRDKYQCHECGQISAEYKDFLTHFHGSHNEDQALRQFFPCFGCKTIFSRRKTALAHKCEPFAVVTDQSALQQATVTFDCDKCRAKFLSEDEMMCHHTTFCAIEE